MRVVKTNETQDLTLGVEPKPETKCHNCLTAKPSFRRTFSDQAWMALLRWGEVNEEMRHKPMCFDCYEELRDVLIERSEEMQSTETLNRAAG